MEERSYTKIIARWFPSSVSPRGRKGKQEHHHWRRNLENHFEVGYGRQNLWN
jgi:hypothetical protein